MPTETYNFQDLELEISDEILGVSQEVTFDTDEELRENWDTDATPSAEGITLDLQSAQLHCRTQHVQFDGVINAELSFGGAGWSTSTRYETGFTLTAQLQPHGDTYWLTNATLDLATTTVETQVDEATFKLSVNGYVTDILDEILVGLREQQTALPQVAALLEKFENGVEDSTRRIRRLVAADHQAAKQAVDAALPIAVATELEQRIAKLQQQLDTYNAARQEKFQKLEEHFSTEQQTFINSKVCQDAAKAGIVTTTAQLAALLTDTSATKKTNKRL